mmetsp:Transcript_22561/g.49204  ORF Transcript_22561/g.49204 Transcript_22561/m.49204 type:complete len:334 (+) Transcript_22561:425-1426(+)
MALHRQVINLSNVFVNVENESRLLVVVKEEHVSHTSIGQGRTKDWNAVDGCPIQDGIVVVYLFAQTMNHFRRRPYKSGWQGIVGLGRLLFNDSFGPFHSGLVLFLVHFFNQGRHPIFKLAIVLVGHQEVTNTIDTLFSQIFARKLKVAHKGGLKTFDDILLDTSRRRDNDVDHFVLDQEPQHFSLPTRNLIAGVGQKDASSDSLTNLHRLQRLVVAFFPRCIGHSPGSHLFDLFHGQSQVGGLKARGEKRVHNGVDLHIVFKIVSFTLLGIGRHGSTLPEYRRGGHGRNMRIARNSAVGGQWFGLQEICCRWCFRRLDLIVKTSAYGCNGVFS